MTKNDYDTLTDAVNDLQSRGYTADFSFREDCIYSKNQDCEFRPSSFEVDEFYRFEGMSNPDDNSIVYAISANDGSKGILVDAYGAYSSPLKEDMIEKFRMRPDTDSPTRG